MIDVQGNRFEHEGLKGLIKNALRENQSLIALDITNNPGCNEKFRKQVALCLLKNIEFMRSNDIEIKEEWIRPDILTFRIPRKVLEGLGISVSD